MATKSQEILLKGNTTNASAVPSSLKVREIAINALDRSLFTNDGNNIVKLYTGTTKWFDVNGNANNALKLGGILASEYINKEAFNSHINNSTIHITSAERTAWNNKWDYNEDTIKAVKVNAAVSADRARYIETKYASGDNWYDRYKLYGQWASDDNNVCDWKLDGYYVRVDIARKLNTARKIWGRPFDGGANVSGDLTEVDNITASGKATIQGDIVCGGEVVAVAGEGTPAGVTDYSALTGKPSINGVTLVSGNNTLATLGIQAAGDYATNSGVTTLLANYADKTFVSNNYVGKTAFNNHTADTDIHITSAERVAWNAKWTYNEDTIKAVKVNSALSADSVAWSGVKDKPTTFTPASHTHTASEISGLPTNLSAFNNDVGYITGITKSMVEGVLTGNITSHTHSYLPLSGGTIMGDLSLNRYLRINAWSGYGSGSCDMWYNGDNGVLSITAQNITNYSGNTFIHSGNIGSQSVSYASTAGVLSIGQLTNISELDHTLWYDWGNKLGDGFANYYYGILLQSADAKVYTRIAGCNSDADLRVRHFNYGNDSGWKTIAFTDSNVASATKLQDDTAFTAWGQTFFQSGKPKNVDGSFYIGSDFGVFLNKNDNGIFIHGTGVSWHDSSNNWIKDCIFFNSYGNVTIGASDLAGTDTKLLVDGNAVIGGAITINKKDTTLSLYSTTEAGIMFMSDGSGGDIAAIYEHKGVGNGLTFGEADRDFIWRTGVDAYKGGGGGTERMRLTNSGNVLIGTTTDYGYKLAVNGSERVYGDLIVDGEVSALVA